MKIINLDKNEYLSPDAFGEEDTLEAVAGSRDGILTGLTILCCDGNGRGGGDLNSEEEIIGRWAGDRIALLGTDVCVASFSAPGLEDIPVVTQVEKTGRDLSEAVIQAIIDGEGNYCTLTHLPAERALRLPYRRLMGEHLRLMKVQHDGRLPTIDDFATLVGLFGASLKETRKRSLRALEAGINQLAEFVGAPHWSIKDAAFEEHDRTVTAVTLQLESAAGEAKTLPLLLGTKSLTADIVLCMLGLHKVLEAFVPAPTLPPQVAQIVTDTLNGHRMEGV